MKKLLVIIILFVCLNSFGVGGHGVITVHAEPNTIQWDTVDVPDIAGYKIYYKKGLEANEPYDGVGILYNNEFMKSPIDVGNTVSVVLDIPKETPYVFVVTAYDTEDLESGFSESIAFKPAYMGKPPPIPQNLSWFKQLVSWIKTNLRAPN